MSASTETQKQEPKKMIRAVEPKKNKKPETTNENGATTSNVKEIKYVPIPDDEFEASLKYGLEKYKEIWKSLADK
jgi:hypothetical protein